MGCSSQRRILNPTDPFHPLSYESKRFSAVAQAEKERNKVEFSMKVVPYNTEQERIINVQLEIPIYNFNQLPPNTLIIHDVFSYSLEESEHFYFRVSDRMTNQVNLMKIVSFDSYDSYAFQSLLYEIYIHKILSPLKDHVLLLTNFYINDYGANRKKHLILLFENCEFTLSDVIEYRSTTLRKPLPEPELLFYMKELSKSFAHLEKSSVCHRDIRPENIWFCLKERKFKISFFSNARFYQPTTSTSLDHNNLINTFRGKPYLCSPEVGKSLEVAGSTMGTYNAVMNDVYGLGLVFLCLKTSKSPPEISLLNKLLNMDNYDETLSSEIIIKMINENYIRRLNYRSIVEMLPDSEIKFPDETNTYPDIIKKLNSLLNTEGLYLLIKEKIAHAYVSLLDNKNAVIQFDELLSIFENNNDFENKAGALKEIGELSELIGNDSSASEYYKESFTIYKEVAKKERKNGRYGRAVDYYLKSLEVGKKILKKNDGKYLSIIENLGNCYRLAGKLEEAKKVQEKALAQFLTLKGDNSIEVARMLNNLGNTYAGLKNYDMAMELFQKCIHLTRTHHAKEHANLLSTALCNLGEVYRHKQMLPEAKIVIEEAIIIKEKLYGGNNGETTNVEVATTLDGLGNIYYDMGEFLKAKKLYEKALKIKDKQLGEFNCETAISFNNLGNVSRCLNEYANAEGFYFQALNFYKSVSTNEIHPNYGPTIGNLGLVQKDLGKKNDALKSLAEAVRLIKPQDPDFTLFRKEYNDLK